LNLFSKQPRRKNLRIKMFQEENFKSFSFTMLDRIIVIGEEERGGGGGIADRFNSVMFLNI